MSLSSPSPRLLTILAFAAIYFVWGSTFFGVSIALKSFPPFLLSALRLIIAGSALVLVSAIRSEPFPSTNDILRNSLWGIVMFVGGLVAVVWAQQYLSSSLASTIITTPFWFVILDKRQWKSYFSSPWIVIGLLTGLAGVIILMSFRQGRAGTTDAQLEIFSIVVMVVGSALWVMASLYLRYHPSSTSVYVSTCLQLLAAGFFCLVISFLVGEPQNMSWNEVRSDSVIALLYLAIVSSLITFMAFVWLIKNKPPVIVSTYSYVNPLIAVLLGWSIGKENITGWQLVALGIILTGVLLVNVPRYRSKTN